MIFLPQRSRDVSAVCGFGVIVALPCRFGGMACRQPKESRFFAGQEFASLCAFFFLGVLLQFAGTRVEYTVSLSCRRVGRDECAADHTLDESSRVSTDDILGALPLPHF